MITEIYVAGFKNTEVILLVLQILPKSMRPEEEGGEVAYDCGLLCLVIVIMIYICACHTHSSFQDFASWNK